MAKNSTKLTCSRTMSFIGRNSKTGDVINIPNVLCFRKGMTRRHSKVVSRGYKDIVGLVSSVGLHKSRNAKLCDFWCHCFKEPELYIGDKPGMLLSESDFVDPAFIKTFKRANEPKWDFFYFTSGGRHARKFKGSDIFGQSLDVLCGEFKLRGLVIKYMKGKRGFLEPEKYQIKKYANLLTIKKTRLTQKQVAKIMAKSRFGFFPNTIDCSPLMMSEALIRNCPVLVNEDILGGWKYVNDKTGCMFNPNSQDSLGSNVESILSGTFSPKEEHLSKYGYINTAKGFAETAGRYIEGFRDFDLVGLGGTKGKMRKLLK